MMFKAYFLLLFLIIGCGKDTIDPVFNEIPITGKWFSRDGTIILNIQNLDNIGTDEKYYEYREGNMRMLRRTYQSIPTNYQIVLSNGYELHLATKGGVIEFLKASK